MLVRFEVNSHCAGGARTVGKFTGSVNGMVELEYT
jgi:hypothetical protein